MRVRAGAAAFVTVLCTAAGMAATTAPAGASPGQGGWAGLIPGNREREGFRTVRAAGFGEVLRGVSFTPGTTGW